MARWLADHDHEVEVFTVERLDEPGFRMESAVQDGVRVHRLFYDVKLGDDPFRNLYDYPPVGAAFRQVVSDRPFDLVHIISGYLLAKPVVDVAREMSLPVVITLTEFWFMCARLNLMQATDQLCSGPERVEKCTRCLMEHKRRYRLPSRATPKLMNLFWSVFEHTPITSSMMLAVSARQAALRNTLDAVDLVICPSRYLIGKFAEFGFKTERFLFVRQGLAAPDTARPDSRRADGDGLRLGYVGQIKTHKGVDLLIDAVVGLLNNQENVSLDIWGTDTESPAYAAALKRRSAHHPAIRWNGRYLGAEVWNVLADMDVLVMPSRWYENSPNSILEAYYMGIPAVVTNLGGMAELVGHEKSGLLFELNDAGDLRRQIRRLIHEPGLLERLRVGIPPVKTIDEEMEEILSHYHRLIERVR
ncbi:MAG: glycosyltransferase [Chloroflexi bacterium]|nr:glycosyltransferase [Chloroflexota bacterium]